MSTPPIIIREAQPTDAEQVIAHMLQMTTEPERNILLGPGEFTITVEQERELFAEFAAAANALYLVAEADGVIVGILSYRGSQRQAIRHVVSLSMSVRKEWRGQGVGSRLLAEAIAHADSSGVVKRMELEVFARNEAAIRLYQKFGFKVEGRRRNAIYQEGVYLDDLVMARLISYVSHQSFLQSW